MSRFLEALHSGRVLLMDGAMGTELQRAGIAEGECYELWNLTHPEQVREIHRSFVIAGARCIVTNTFQSNPFSLAKFGLEDRLEEINEAAVANARAFGGVNHFILGSIGPILVDVKDEEFDIERYWAALDRTVRSFWGVDALLFETWSDCSMLWPGQSQVRDLNPYQLPILGSFAFRRGPVPKVAFLDEGIAPEAVVGSIIERRELFPELAAFGVNCGKDIGMDEIIEITRRYRRVTELPLFARPNAGTPTRNGAKWVYPLTPEMMAERLPELLGAGATMVGGCCGTTPAHIAALRPVIDAWNAGKRKIG